jgi:hypothetical protein
VPLEESGSNDSEHQDRAIRLTTVRGPFASVHFDESHDTENAAKQITLRLKGIEAELSDIGADAETIAAIVGAVGNSSPPVGRAGRTLIGAHGSVYVDERLPAPPPAQVVRWSGLPYLLPLVTHAEEHPSYLEVVVDQLGAEVTTHGRDGVHTLTVAGHDHPVHKVRGGGTAHRDIQARAEETARRNLENVAAAVVKAAAHAHLVLLTGEVQSRTGVYELLPDHVRRITQQVEGGSRAPGASLEQLDRQVHELLTGRHLATLDDVATTFRAESGRDSGLAVSGLESVTGALAEANVATLLVTEPAAATVFTGPEPAQVSVGKDGLRALGVPDPAQQRADEALPFAAVATGADIVVLDERLPLWEGFGALLRHS